MGVPPGRAAKAPGSARRLPQRLPVEQPRGVIPQPLVASPTLAEERRGSSGDRADGETLPPAQARHQPPYHFSPSPVSTTTLTNTQRPQGRLAHPGDSSPSQVASTCPTQAGSCPPAFPGLPHAPDPNRPKASLRPAAFALLGHPASRATAAVWHPPGGSGLRLVLEGPGLGSQRPHNHSETGHLKAVPTMLGPRPGQPELHVLKSQQPRPVHTPVITCRELGPPAVLVRPHLAVPAHCSPPPLG